MLHPLHSHGAITTTQAIPELQLNACHLNAVRCPEFLTARVEGLNLPKDILDQDKSAMRGTADALTRDTADAADLLEDDARGIDDSLHQGTPRTTASRKHDTTVVADSMQINTIELTYEQFVTKKYYYAGGSARFMFEHTLVDLIKTLDNRMGNFDDKDWGSLTRGYVSDSTRGVVNTLMQQFTVSSVGNQHGAAPVSKYVLYRAYDNVKDDLVESICKVAANTKNPTLQEWAIELKRISVDGRAPRVDWCP